MEGSSLDNTDLVVLQMTTVTDIKRHSGKRTVVHIVIVDMSLKRSKKNVTLKDIHVARNIYPQQISLADLQVQTRGRKTR